MVAVYNINEAGIFSSNNQLWVIRGEYNSTFHSAVFSVFSFNAEHFALVSQIKVPRLSHFYVNVHVEFTHPIIGFESWTNFINLSI